MAKMSEGLAWLTAVWATALRSRMGGFTPLNLFKIQGAADRNSPF